MLKLCQVLRQRYVPLSLFLLPPPLSLSLSFSLSFFFLSLLSLSATWAILGAEERNAGGMEKGSEKKAGQVEYFSLRQWKWGRDERGEGGSNGFRSALRNGLNSSPRGRPDSPLRAERQPLMDYLNVLPLVFFFFLPCFHTRIPLCVCVCV